MKTVLITGDSWLKDPAIIMKELEWLFSVRALPEEFSVVSTNAEGVEATINPVLVDAGIPVTITDELPEVIDIIVVLLTGKEERAHTIMMEQWMNKRPVYPFYVSPPA